LGLFRISRAERACIRDSHYSDEILICPFEGGKGLRVDQRSGGEKERVGATSLWGLSEKAAGILPLVEWGIQGQTWRGKRERTEKEKPC